MNFNAALSSMRQLGAQTKKFGLFEKSKDSNQTEEGREATAAPLRPAALYPDKWQELKLMEKGLFELKQRREMEWNEDIPLYEGRVKSIQLQKEIIQKEYQEYLLQFQEIAKSDTTVDENILKHHPNMEFYFCADGMTHECTFLVEFAKKKVHETFGLTLGQFGETIVYVEGFKDGPDGEKGIAERSQLIEVGDVLVSINSDIVFGWMLDKVADRIRQAFDDDFTLEFCRCRTNGLNTHISKSHAPNRFNEKDADVVQAKKEEIKEHLVKLEELLFLTTEKWEVEKMKLYFPEVRGFRVSFGSDGTYIGMKSLFVETGDIYYTLDLSSAASEDAHLTLRLHGADYDSTNKNKTGASFLFRGQQVKVIGEPGSNVSKMDIEELTIQAEIVAEIPIKFRHNGWHIGKGYRFKLLKLSRKIKGMIKLPQQLLKWIMNRILPGVMKRTIQEHLPIELGTYLATSDHEVLSTSGRILIQGDDLAALDASLNQESHAAEKALQILGLTKQQATIFLQLLEESENTLSTLSQIILYIDKYFTTRSDFEALILRWQSLIDIHFQTKSVESVPSISFSDLIRRADDYRKHPITVEATVFHFRCKINLQKALDFGISYLLRETKKAHEESKSNGKKNSFRKSASLVEDLNAVSEWGASVNSLLNVLTKLSRSLKADLCACYDIDSCEKPSLKVQHLNYMGKIMVNAAFFQDILYIPPSTQGVTISNHPESGELLVRILQEDKVVLEIRLGKVNVDVCLDPDQLHQLINMEKLPLNVLSLSCQPTSSLPKQAHVNVACPDIEGCRFSFQTSDWAMLHTRIEKVSACADPSYLAEAFASKAFTEVEQDFSGATRTKIHLVRDFLQALTLTLQVSMDEVAQECVVVIHHRNMISHETQQNQDRHNFLRLRMNLVDILASSMCSTTLSPQE